MSNDPRNLTSDEMIRRARGDQDDDFTLPSYSALREEAEAAAEKHAEEQAVRKAEEAQRKAEESRRSRETAATETPTQQAVEVQPHDSDSVLEDEFGAIAGVGYTAEQNAGTDEKVRFRFPLGWLRWVGAAVVLVFFLTRFFDASTSVDALEVGNCFDDPGGDEIYSVKLIDCNDWHDFEVFALVQLEGNNGAFPGDDALFTELAAECLTQFDAYVGHPYATSQYDFSGLTPLAEGWAEGDYEGVCLIHRFNDDGILPKSSSAQNAGI